MLYELQKVCTDYERDLYAVDLVEWARSLFRRRIKRPLPEQREVLLLMSSGLDNREIAETLVIEYSTVRHHVGNVVAKLGAHSKLEAVARATKLNLVCL